MMHMTYTGYGYFVYSVLSFSPFDVLARLTYSAYLYHPIIMGIFYFNSTEFFYYSTTGVAIHFLGFSVLAFTAATISFLIIERPMMNLEKMLHAPPKRTPQ